MTSMTNKFAKPPFEDSAIYFDLRVYVHLNNNIVNLVYDKQVLN